MSIPGACPPALASHSKLFEADVNFKVVKQFTSAVKERALGHDVLESLNPGQQVVKVVSDELTQLMGGAGRDLALAKPARTCTSRARGATRLTSRSGPSTRPSATGAMP